MIRLISCIATWKKNRHTNIVQVINNILLHNSFVLNCSNAILQYLADQYDASGELYPKDNKLRAVVNHRLCFNLALYYRNISEYVVSLY